ncbi:MAG TPA: class I SAM-dependent methyltransferase [Thermomicrobiaceae bacterium]|nr:class I SAM-dependent methyltransferase [Thermomicrobiaceae bacterium]
MRQVGGYDIEDVRKIQGRDEVYLYDRSLAGLRLRHALDALAQTRGRLLVLGCGAGRYVRALARVRTDLELHGGDLSLTALHEARGRDARHHYVGLDASRLPYREASFDAVVFFDLLEHVPDYRQMLDEITRVLVPGGVLHLFVPLEAQRGTVYWLLRGSRRLPINRWKRDHVGHVNRFRAEDVLHDVWAAGLEVTDMSYGFHAAGQVHDVVDYWQRERLSGAPGLLPPSAVNLLARLTFIPTWRLSYLEDRLYSGRLLASGLHLTAHKPAPAHAS